MTVGDGAFPGGCRVADNHRPQLARILSTMDTATRLLELLALLHARPVWRGEVLADRLGVTERTVRRDVTRLRSLDYPVESVTGPHGGYRLGRGHDLPPLVLDDQEALAVVLGLRTAAANRTDELEEAAATAVAKLERVLPERLAARVRDLDEATVTLDGWRHAPTEPDTLLVLAQACRRGQRVRFMYVDRAGTRSLRLVDPYRLVHVAHRWYLLCFDRDRVEWRTFRLDRLRSPVPTGDDTELPDEPDAQTMVRRAIGQAPWPVHARVRLHLPHDEIASWLPARAGVLDPDGPTACILETGTDRPETLARWLAGMPCRVEVLEPDTVAQALREHVGRVLGDA